MTGLILPGPLQALLSPLNQALGLHQLYQPKHGDEGTLMERLAVLARPFTAAFIVASHFNIMRLNTISISINLGGNHHSMEASLTQSF